MTLGQRMKPLGWMHWAGILLAGGGGGLTLLSTALISGHYPNTPFMPLKWLLLAGIAGLLGGAVLVQCTWNAHRESIRHG